MFRACAVTNHAGLDVRAQQLNSQTVEGRADCGDLIQDIHAVPIVGNHPLNAGHLARDAVDTGGYAFSGRIVHVWAPRVALPHYTTRGYILISRIAYGECGGLGQRRAVYGNTEDSPA